MGVTTEREAMWGDKFVDDETPYNMCVLMDFEYGYIEKYRRALWRTHESEILKEFQKHHPGQKPLENGFTRIEALNAVVLDKATPLWRYPCLICARKMLQLGCLSRSSGTPAKEVRYARQDLNL